MAAVGYRKSDGRAGDRTKVLGKNRIVMELFGNCLLGIEPTLELVEGVSQVLYTGLASFVEKIYRQNDENYNGNDKATAYAAGQFGDRVL